MVACSLSSRPGEGEDERNWKESREAGRRLDPHVDQDNGRRESEVQPAPQPLRNLQGWVSVE